MNLLFPEGYPLEIDSPTSRVNTQTVRRAVITTSLHTRGPILLAPSVHELSELIGTSPGSFYNKLPNVRDYPSFLSTVMGLEVKRQIGAVLLDDITCVQDATEGRERIGISNELVFTKPSKKQGKNKVVRPHKITEDVVREGILAASELIEEPTLLVPVMDVFNIALGVKNRGAVLQKYYDRVSFTDILADVTGFDGLPHSGKLVIIGRDTSVRPATELAFEQGIVLE